MGTVKNRANSLNNFYVSINCKLTIQCTCGAWVRVSFLLASALQKLAKFLSTKTDGKLSLVHLKDCNSAVKRFCMLFRDKNIDIQSSKV